MDWTDQMIIMGGIVHGGTSSLSPSWKIKPVFAGLEGTHLTEIPA
jgi:hypothetical protein